ncbi:MAG: YcxB family protein [Lachnospiraceae bacterium]|nr:YcxB family protein [Lachnospiraceae bacterium]
MQYNYRYRVKTSDLWQASMYYAYSSYMGVVNIACIAASIALIVSKWRGASDFFRAVLILFLLTFTVIQPVMIWFRAKASLKGHYPELDLTFSDSGMIIEADGKRQHKGWKDVKGVVKKPTILVVYMGDGQGYILRNSILGNTKKGLFKLINDMTATGKK